ncbi:MAG TPA: DMT family transporter [Myxococcota bacterium]|nr:DMT family transporter [Myxococcota bacterium]
MSASVLVAILLAQTCGGLTPILTKLALAGFGPWSMVAVRQLLGVCVLFAMSRWLRGAVPVTRAPQPFSRRDWALLLTVSWAGFALPQVLLAHGIARSSGTNGALLSPLEPIGILLGGALFFGERLTSWRLLAVGLGTLGALLIVLQGGVRPELGDPLGDGLIAAGHLAWAIYTLAAKPLLERHDPGRVSLVAVLLSIPILVALALGEPFQLERALPALGWMVLLAVLASALGPLAWNYALQQISAGTMAAFIFVQPLIGLVAGRALLSEPVGALALLGALLILVGVTLEGLRTEPRTLALAPLDPSAESPSSTPESQPK